MESLKIAGSNPVMLAQNMLRELVATAPSNVRFWGAG
jgi:hypothetical protein